MTEEKLKTTLQTHGGIITAKQGKTAGMSNTRITQAVRSGDLERVSHGVYGGADEFNDELYSRQIRKSKAIYSHDTALYLHGLTDRDPLAFSVTVPTGYNTKRLVSEGFTVFSVKSGLFEIGIIEMSTKYGHPVKTYSAERTICDCVRSRSRMDVNLTTEAIKRYVVRKDKDIHSLMDIATKFGVQKIMRVYLEVLL